MGVRKCKSSSNRLKCRHAHCPPQRIYLFFFFLAFFFILHHHPLIFDVYILYHIKRNLSNPPAFFSAIQTFFHSKIRQSLSGGQARRMQTPASCPDCRVIGLALTRKSLRCPPIFVAGQGSGQQGVK